MLLRPVTFYLSYDAREEDSHHADIKKDDSVHCPFTTEKEEDHQKGEFSFSAREDGP